MKTVSLILVCCASVISAQKTPLQEFPKIKLDTTNVYNFIPKSIKKQNFYGKSLNENTENLSYKMMVKKIENPENYAVLNVVPKENTIQIPNTFEVKFNARQPEFLEQKK